MKRSLLWLSVALVSFAVGCKKTPPSADAAAEAAAPEPPEAGPAEPMDAGVEAAAPLATTKPIVNKPVATGGPFQGSYKCFGGMTTTQTGSSLAARLYPGKDDYGTISCTIKDEVCDGTVSSFKKGQAKPTETHKVKLTRNPANGNLTYKGDGEVQPVVCNKS